MTVPDILVQCSFVSDYTDTTPTWVDITGYVLGFSIRRGRDDAESSCDPGGLSLALDNTSGDFDPDNASGPFYGYLRPMRRLRVTATVGGNPYVRFTGYSGDWIQVWDGGEFSVTTVDALDRSSVLATAEGITLSSPAEDSDVRLEALLDEAGVSSTDYDINPGSFATRALVAHPYEDENPLQSVQDVERSDGGVLFVNGTGTYVYHPVTHRQIGGATRSRTSQVKFGNDDDLITDKITVKSDLSRGVQRASMANIVKVTDGAGTVHSTDDSALVASDGPLVLDLGATLLDSADAPDRIGDVLNLRKNPTQRYPSVSVELFELADSTDTETVLGLELSDRATVAVIPAGLSVGTERDQWIESVEDSYTPASNYTITFGLSSAGDSVTVIP